VSKEYVFPAILSNEYEGGKLWVVTFLGLKGCWVEGTDKDEVLARAPKVLKEYLNSCIEKELLDRDFMSIEELEEANNNEVIAVKCVL